MASLDLHVAKIVICQLNDSQNYTKVMSKLNVFRPAEVSFADGSKNEYTELGIII